MWGDFRGQRWGGKEGTQLEGAGREGGGGQGSRHVRLLREEPAAKEKAVVRSPGGEGGSLWAHSSKVTSSQQTGNTTHVDIKGDVTRCQRARSGHHMVGMAGDRRPTDRKLPAGGVA